jgi:flagellar biosynthesis/type III secretory pathway M-ring protein FliF/YscJ
MDAANVRVIDGATGTHRRPRREGDIVATTALELAARYEDETRTKIGEMLSFIPGVIVSVTAQVDATKREGQEHRYFSPEEGGTTSFVTSETVSESTSGSAAPGAQPGPRSNATANISQASGSGGTSTQTSTGETTIQPFVGHRTEHYVDPRGMTTGLAVSINVPEGFVLGLARAGLEAGEEPEAAAIDAKWTELEAKIKANIMPHVRTMTQQATGVPPTEEAVADFVQVMLMPGEAPSVMGAGGGGGGLLASLGGPGGSLGSLGGLIDKGVLAVLALVAVGLMFTLVRKASKQVEMPTAEELVGVPPTLETPSDLIGEADESDMAMAGIEVGEEQVKSRRMLEEVAKMVQTNPDAAARLMKQWISSED